MSLKPQLEEIKNIENKVHNKDKSVSMGELFAVAKFYYSKSQETVDYKIKLSALKTAGFYCILAFKSGLNSPEDLFLAREIVTSAMDQMSFPETFSSSLSKITKKWLEVSGNDKAKILQTQKFKVQIETGMLVVFDSNLDEYFNGDYKDKIFINLFNQAKIFAIGIGGDTKVNIEFRLLDSKEPILETKEYAKLEKSSQVYNITSSDGGLYIDDYIRKLDDKSNIKLTTGPGNYKICMFILKTGKIIISTCKSQDNSNNITELPYLEY